MKSLLTVYSLSEPIVNYKQ